MNSAVTKFVPLDQMEQRLTSYALNEFLGLSIPPRSYVLDPIIPTQGLAMLYAQRGVGKTHVGIGISLAVAAGGGFLKWRAPGSKRVLYVDGEMPAAAMQQRIAQVNRSVAQSFTSESFRIVTPDLQDMPIPDLASAYGQTLLEPLLDGVELLVLDNLSTLCRSGRENEADGWTAMQTWLLSLRRRGMSVLLIHHGGKGGTQRGTSKREDVLDTVINLRRPSDYVATQGARFEIHLEKSRGITGDTAKPFEAQLETRDGVAVWTMKNIEDARGVQIGELVDLGMSVRDIAEELSIPRSTVHRIKKRLEVSVPREE
jgi:putative DNA primase/helicase